MARRPAPPEAGRWSTPSPRTVSRGPSHRRRPRRRCAPSGPCRAPRRPWCPTGCPTRRTRRPSRHRITHHECPGAARRKGDETLPRAAAGANTNWRPPLPLGSGGASRVWSRCGLRARSRQSRTSRQAWGLHRHPGLALAGGLHRHPGLALAAASRGGSTPREGSTCRGGSRQDGWGRLRTPSCRPSRYAPHSRGRVSTPRWSTRRSGAAAPVAVERSTPAGWRSRGRADRACRQSRRQESAILRRPDWTCRVRPAAARSAPVGAWAPWGRRTSEALRRAGSPRGGSRQSCKQDRPEPRRPDWLRRPQLAVVRSARQGARVCPSARSGASG